MTTNHEPEPIEHVDGQEQLPTSPLTTGPNGEIPTEATPLADAAPAPASPDPGASPGATPGEDDSRPEPPPVTDVPYAPEYVVPDPATQAQLDAQVPDDPTPLPDDGSDEGDDTPAGT